MLLLITRYTVPPDQMGDQAEGHRAWVRDHVEAGHFIAAGPEVPLQGGIAVAVGVTRAQLAEWVKDDPYHVHGLAQHDIREYAIEVTGPGVEVLRG